MPDVTERAARMVIHAILEIGQRPVSYSELAVASSYSRAQTARTLRMLLRHGLIVRSGNGGRGGFTYGINTAKVRDLLFQNVRVEP